jgi:hypothetical protein
VSKLFVPQYVDFHDGVWLYRYEEWEGPRKHKLVEVLINYNTATNSMQDCIASHTNYTIPDTTDYDWRVREKLRKKRKYWWVPDKGKVMIGYAG